MPGRYEQVSRVAATALRGVCAALQRIVAGVCLQVASVSEPLGELGALGGAR